MSECVDDALAAFVGGTPVFHEVFQCLDFVLRWCQAFLYDIGLGGILGECN